MQTMTLEEKVGQVLMVHFHGEAANENARSLIQDTKVGGIIYYNWANKLSSPEQVKTLSLGLQKLTEANRLPIPIFIAADQEGGVVNRLNQGFTKFPGNKALGMTDKPELAEEAASAMGQELRMAGINMNLAPVADVNINPRNPIIGVRSFGEDPETVITFAKKALQGFKNSQIIATLKHFPGHGDVEIDSHEDLPRVNKSLAELERVELLPFARLSSFADVIMTAHILVPALDAENCSILSEKTLTYLKDTIGFRGVIIADSLVMEGVLKKCHTVDEAAIQALNAGCDILLLGGRQLVGSHDLELASHDIQRIHQSIVTAVKTGRVTEARLNEAVEKVIKLKERYLNIKMQNAQVIELRNTQKHNAIAKRIASKALKVIQNVPSSNISLNQKKVFIFAPQLLHENIIQTPLLKIGKTTDSYFFSEHGPSNEDFLAARQLAESADVLLVCSYNAWKNPSQTALIQSLLDTGKPLILLVTRDPVDGSLFPRANFIINTFSPASVSIQAACDHLNLNL